MPREDCGMSNLIKDIELKFGPSGPGSRLAFPPATMTVVVGPNSSGKSLILREIFQHCSNGPQANPKILASITLHFPPESEVRSMLKKKMADNPPDIAR
jgi:hypothetical protein